MHPIVTIFLMMHLAMMPQDDASRATSPGENGVAIDRDTLATGRDVSGPYCGINCAYAAMSYFGTNVLYPELYQESYLDLYKGSNMLQLSRMVADQGLTTLLLENCDDGVLALDETVAILHVKSNRTLKEYDHYVLCLGVQDDGYIIVDPPSKPTVLSKYELYEIWSRRGLLISSNPQLGELVWMQRLWSTGHMLLYIMAAFIGIQCFAAMRVRKRRRFAGGGILVDGWLVGIMIAVGGASGLVYSINHPHGILSQESYASDVFAKYMGDTIRYLDGYDDFIELLRVEHPIVVDARGKSDYIQKHIEGAVNVPYYTTGPEIARRLHDHVGTQNERKIIVYCKSRTCRYSHELADRLQSLGYRNVYVYAGGYDEWRARRDEVQGGSE